MTSSRPGIKLPSPSEGSNDFSSSDESSLDLALERRFSLKLICQFSVTFYQRGSEDLKNRLYAFLEENSSTLEVIDEYSKQIQHFFSYLAISGPLIILAFEMFWCLSLLSNIPFEPGFCFLFILVIIVCVGINGRIMTHFLNSRSAPLKDKSKEI